MQIGIIGLPNSGKSTVFDLLVGNQQTNPQKAKSKTAIAKIPDYRLDYLSNYYKPKKTTYAQLDLVDIPGLATGNASYTFLDEVRQADALLFILKAFDSELDMEPPNPFKDMTVLKEELLLADLDLIEKRIERSTNNKKKVQSKEEIDLLHGLKFCLESEKPLSSYEFAASDRGYIDNYNLLTLKSALICINIAEKDITSNHKDNYSKLFQALNELQWEAVIISAAIEQEITRLGGEDKHMFMDDLGIAEPGIAQISRSLYSMLGLISFFTVGEDEVKAWTISKNTPAKKAAGKIHSDIEKGFIRAEVAKYDRFYEHKSLSVLRDKGLLRLEGKEYIIQDGDIVHFRFNV